MALVAPILAGPTVLLELFQIQHRSWAGTSALWEQHCSHQSLADLQVVVAPHVVN